MDTITLVPENGRLRIEVRGELAAILRMARGAKNTKSAGGDADALAVGKLSWLRGQDLNL